MRRSLLLLPLLLMTAPALAQSEVKSPYTGGTVRNLGTLSADEAGGQAMTPDQSGENPPNFIGDEGNLPPLSDSAYLTGPVEQTSGSIRYVSGGIGDDEKEWFKQQGAGYNLHLLNTARPGDFMGNLALRLKNSQNTEVLNATGVGPYFYASLPPGTYRLEVEAEDGRTQQRTVKVGRSEPLTLNLIW